MQKTSYERPANIFQMIIITLFTVYFADQMVYEFFLSQNQRIYSLSAALAVLTGLLLGAFLVSKRGWSLTGILLFLNLSAIRMILAYFGLDSLFVHGLGIPVAVLGGLALVEVFRLLFPSGSQMDMLSLMKGATILVTGAAGSLIFGLPVPGFNQYSTVIWLAVALIAGILVIRTGKSTLQEKLPENLPLFQGSPVFQNKKGLYIFLLLIILTLVHRALIDHAVVEIVQADGAFIFLIRWIPYAIGVAAAVLFFRKRSGSLDLIIGCSFAASGLMVLIYSYFSGLVLVQIITSMVWVFLVGVIDLALVQLLIVVSKNYQKREQAVLLFISLGVLITLLLERLLSEWSFSGWIGPSGSIHYLLLILALILFNVLRYMEDMENAGESILIPSGFADPKNSGTEALITEAYGFSPRELEVVRLLLRGFTYNMVAEELFISVNTVRSHITSIYTKTGVGSKGELVRKLKGL